MKGILLAGGSGSRLYPVTESVSKQLLPIYDKPMIYYPLSVLMLAGIQDILIISTPKDTPNMKDLLGDGSELGMNFSYSVQEKPNGIAEAFIIAQDFIGNSSVALILGDNIFYGTGFKPMLQKAAKIENGALIFGYPVHDPQRFGVIEFDKSYNVISLEEKPMKPKSDWAVVGLYFYDNKVAEYAQQLKPSPRGELEITDLNKIYLQKENLKVQIMGRGFAWLDAGTPQSMLEAGSFVRTIQERQGFMISSIEEIAYRMGFIDINKLRKLAQKQKESSYCKYLLALANELEKTEE